jgi:hypothetical protein
VPILPKRPVRRRADGRFDVVLTDVEQQMLRRYLEQLRDLLMGEDQLLRRLFPPAYADDAKRDQDYQTIMRGDLIESRFVAIETMEQTLSQSVIDEQQLTGWMQAINSLRLVVGTRLDVGEELPDLDPDDPDFGLWVLYEDLGWLLSYVVDALAEALPPARPDTPA